MLGAELLPATVSSPPGFGGEPAAGPTSVALASLRQWATQTTVSVVVNATAPEGVCVEVVGLPAGLLTPGTGGCGRPGSMAATVVSLSRGGNQTETTLVPCLPVSPSGAPCFQLAGGGTVSALSFAIEKL
jgi:hypothetical protein